MASEIKTYPNGVLTTSYPKQTVEDKMKMIENNTKAIANARKALKATTNPKKIAHCQEIINNCTEANARLREDIRIISRNPWHDLCTAKWAEHKEASL